MANSLTSRDCYTLMNLIVKQATGQESIAVTDTSSFVSVGETVLRTGTENTLSAISTVLAETIFSIRPYKAKFDSLRVSANKWGAMVRKLVPLYSEAEKSDDWNTETNPSQLADGQAVDMFKIQKPKMIQLNFYGTQVLQKHITRFRDQLALAFRSEEEFAQFIDAVMMEFSNEIELLNENKARALVLNYIAGLYHLNGSNVIKLRSSFNAKYGTTYSRDELLSNHLSEFMKFMASEVKKYSSRLTDMSSLYHANLTGYAPILKHSPKSRQRMIMYEPIFIESQSEVYSTLFNPEFLDIGVFEGVNYWQSQDDATSIKITPNVLNPETGVSVTGDEINVDYVAGLLFDEEALGIMPQFDYASTTPFNSAGGYYNMFVHWRFNAYNDFTENAILFVID